MIDTRRAAMAHARHLAGDIGQRPSGLPANQAAAEYIAGVFAAAGLAVEHQAFPCPR